MLLQARVRFDCIQYWLKWLLQARVTFDCMHHNKESLCLTDSMESLYFKLSLTDMESLCFS